MLFAENVAKGNNLSAAPELIIEKFEEYFKDLLGIISIYERYPRPANIEFRWNTFQGSATGILGSSNSFKDKSIYFETILTLLVYVYALNKHASQTVGIVVDVDPSENLRQAITLFRKALGALDYVICQLLPQYSATEITPEISIPYLQCLKNIQAGAA